MNQHELRAALQALAEENAATPPPREIETRVMAAFDARHKRNGRRIPGAVFALAATLALAAFLWRRPAVVAERKEPPFVAIPYVAPPAPYERTEVKRMNVPIAALMAAGLEVHATEAGGSVRADVLVGQDGRPLAIRLLRNAI